MSERLFVGVLGHRNSGKTSTWNELFGGKVRTGKKPRTLELYGGECVEVFLVSGSFEERELYAGDVLKDQSCRIVLCSIQYTEAARHTLNYVIEEEFDLFIQWLNPGYSDTGEAFDRLGLTSWLLGHDATISMRDGQTSLKPRVEEIRQFVHGWAKRRNLTFACP